MARSQQILSLSCIPIPPRPHSAAILKEHSPGRQRTNAISAIIIAMDDKWFTYVYLAAGIAVLMLIFRARRAGSPPGMVPIACAIIVVVAFLVFINSVTR
jgi:hypothetical protein